VRGKTLGGLWKAWLCCDAGLRNGGEFPPFRRLTVDYAAPACPKFCRSYDFILHSQGENALGAQRRAAALKSTEPSPAALRLFPRLGIFAASVPLARFLGFAEFAALPTIGRSGRVPRCRLDLAAFGEALLSLVVLPNGGVVAFTRVSLGCHRSILLWGLCSVLPGRPINPRVAAGVRVDRRGQRICE
jgi:hypothetical protein